MLVVVIVSEKNHLSCRSLYLIERSDKIAWEVFKLNYTYIYSSGHYQLYSSGHRFPALEHVLGSWEGK